MGLRSWDPRRRWRSERKQELKDRGIRPSRVKRILRVRITAIPMPDWAARRRIPHLTFTDRVVWLSLRDGQFLARLDTDAGGETAVAETEYRRCPVCSRPLIGEDAKYRRGLDESAVEGRRKVCGDECAEASRDGRWRNR